MFFIMRWTAGPIEVDEPQGVRRANFLKGGMAPHGRRIPGPRKIVSHYFVLLIIRRLPIVPATATRQVHVTMKNVNFRKTKTLMRTRFPNRYQSTQGNRPNAVMPNLFDQLPVILVTLFLCSLGIEAHAQEEKSLRKGVFIGDYVGCEFKSDLLAYYDASDVGDQTAMSKIVSQNKCRKITGRAYVPLRVGFVTARVLVTFQEKDVKLWVRTAAVVDSPPPPRDTHFNF